MSEKLLGIINQFRKKRILVIGDLMLDKYIWGNVSRISPEAPVQVVNVKKETYLPGGAANVANNISALGGKALLIGLVGNDIPNSMLLSLLKKKAVEIQGIIHHKNKPTTQKIRVIANNQQLLRVDYENREYINQEEEKRIMKYIKIIISKIDVVIISDYAKGLITKTLMQGIIRIAKQNNVDIIVDPKPKHVQYYRNVTLVTPNHKEACEMIGIEKKNNSLEKTGREISRMLNANILITRGEKGMTLFEASKITNIPTKAKEVYDVTGAGDTVVAALGLAMGAKASLKQAAIIANHAAGITVGKVGASTVSLKELKKSVEED